MDDVFFLLHPWKMSFFFTVHGWFLFVWSMDVFFFAIHEYHFLLSPWMMSFLLSMDDVFFFLFSIYGWYHFLLSPWMVFSSQSVDIFFFSVHGWLRVLSSSQSMDIILFCFYFSLLVDRKCVVSLLTECMLSPCWQNVYWPLLMLVTSYIHELINLRW